jgi:hypothetical protein
MRHSQRLWLSLRRLLPKLGSQKHQGKGINNTVIGLLQLGSIAFFVEWPVQGFSERSSIHRVELKGRFEREFHRPIQHVHHDTAAFFPWPSYRCQLPELEDEKSLKSLISGTLEPAELRIACIFKGSEQR